MLSDHSKIQLLVFVNDSDSVYPVLNTFGFMNSSWIQERVDYSAERPHRVLFHNYNKLINIIITFLLLFFFTNYCPSSKLILQANCSCSDMSIALDDIYIMRNESCNEITPTTTPNPPTTTSSPPSAMDCTFEHGEAHFKMQNGILITFLWYQSKTVFSNIELTRTRQILTSFACVFNLF